MQILYSYDDLNKTKKIKRYVDGSNDETLLDNVQYNTESLITQFDYGNSLQSTFTHDSKDRTSTIDVKNGETSFLDLDYAYDGISRPDRKECFAKSQTACDTLCSYSLLVACSYCSFDSDKMQFLSQLLNFFDYL